MAKNLNLNLKSADDYKGLFKSSSSSKIKVVKIEIDRLEEYPQHPFKTDNQEQIIELAASIKENGLLNPIIIWEYKEDKFYILCGHRRTLAHKHLLFETIECIIKKDISKDEADLLVVDSNLKQREKLFPSEKAKAYKMQIEALKNQGKRSDLTLSHNETKLNSGKIVAEINNESRATIYRYLALNNLILPLLDCVDNEIIPLKIGVELSNFLQDEQIQVYTYFIEHGKAKLDIQILEKLKTIKNDTDLSYGDIDKVIDELSMNKLDTKQLKIPVKKINGLLDNIEESKRIDYVIEAIKFFHENNVNSVLS